jgi:hypothetical protein
VLIISFIAHDGERVGWKASSSLRCTSFSRWRSSFCRRPEEFEEFEEFDEFEEFEGFEEQTSSNS